MSKNVLLRGSQWLSSKRQFTLTASTTTSVVVLAVPTSASKDLQKSDGSEHSSHSSQGDTTGNTPEETGRDLLEPILVSEEAETHPGDEGMKYIAEQVIKEIIPSWKETH